MIVNRMGLAMSASSNGDAVVVLNRDLFFGIRLNQLLKQLGYQVKLETSLEAFLEGVTAGNVALGIIDISFAPDWDRGRIVAYAQSNTWDDRIARLTSAFAHNQAPRPRLNHQISRVECWPIDGGAGCRVLSSQTIHQYRPGRHGCVYVAEIGHVLRRTDDGWRIEIKRISLIDHDQALEPPTLL